MEKYNAWFEMAQKRRTVCSCAKVQSLYEVLRIGHLDCIRSRVPNYLCPGNSTCAQMAMYGHLDCLRFFHESGYKWDESTTNNAYRMGHLNCLRYAIENGCPYNRRLLLVNLVDRTTQAGRLDCLQYIYPLNHILNLDCDAICVMAVHGGYLVHLQYLHQSGATWDEAVCIRAVKTGSLECLRYAHDNGCPWTEATILAAIRVGSLKCLTYAHNNGCPWTEETVSTAVQLEQYDCLIYAYRNGCPGADRQYYLIRRQLLWKYNIVYFWTIVRLRIYVHRFKERYYAPGGKGYLKSMTRLRTSAYN